MLRHVALVTPFVADALRSGLKRVESRLSRTRRPPFGWVSPGDEIYFKVVGGGLLGVARVRRFLQLEQLRPADVRSLGRRFGAATAAPPGYWQERLDCRFALLIWLSPLGPARRRIRVRRQFGSAWVVLGRPEGLRSAKTAPPPLAYER